MPDAKKTCFVVMGFGRKTDYQSGRVLDLDKSYQYFIKPAAEATGLECQRADEIVHSGLIDVPMYEQLLSADVVIADVSTANANAFYELGVRHALRPYTTITIAEDKMLFPFDVSHLAIRRYQHLGEGIDFGEVMRMSKVLKDAITQILLTPQNDSPVYALVPDLVPPSRKAHADGRVLQLSTLLPEEGANPTLRVLIDQSNSALEKSDFMTARTVLEAVRAMAPQDPYVAQKLAFATYKSKSPDQIQALGKAKSILTELQPDSSTDPETLGLWGAVHKQLWELTNDRQDLEEAIRAYEKGFYIRNDYYNGINLAFLFNVRASISTGSDAVADSVMAGRVRKRVLDICQTSLSTATLTKEQQYWIWATVAEAWVGLGDQAKEKESLAEAYKVMTADWMRDSTESQLAKLKKLLNR